jgi:hypothetical protein
VTIPNGRGRGHNKKPITNREARRIARYNAGLIIDSVLSEGWGLEDVIEKYGEKGLGAVQDQLKSIALWLRETGDPDGEVTK